MQQRTEGSEFTQQHAYRVLAQLIRMRRRYSKHTSSQWVLPYLDNQIEVQTEKLRVLAP